MFANKKRKTDRVVDWELPAEICISLTRLHISRRAPAYYWQPTLAVLLNTKWPSHDMVTQIKQHGEKAKKSIRRTDKNN